MPFGFDLLYRGVMLIRAAQCILYTGHPPLAVAFVIARAARPSDLKGHCQAKPRQTGLFRPRSARNGGAGWLLAPPLAIPKWGSEHPLIEAILSHEKAVSTFDAVALEVLWNRLISIVDETGAMLCDTHVRRC